MEPAPHAAVQGTVDNLFVVVVCAFLKVADLGRVVPEAVEMQEDIATVEFQDHVGTAGLRWHQTEEWVAGIGL